MNDSSNKSTFGSSDQIKFAFSLQIRLEGAELEPTKIEKLVGVAADRSHQQGKHSTTSSGKTIIHKSGLWCIETRLFEFEPIVGVEEAVDTVFDDLLPRLVKIKSTIKQYNGNLSKLPNVDAAYASFFFHAINQIIGPTFVFLSAQKMSVISQLGLSIYFSVSQDVQ